MIILLCLLGGCAGPQLPEPSDVTLAPLPCVVQFSLGADFSGNPRQLNRERDR